MFGRRRAVRLRSVECVIGRGFGFTSQLRNAPMPGRIVPDDGSLRLQGWIASAEDVLAMTGKQETQTPAYGQIGRAHV